MTLFYALSRRPGLRLAALLVVVTAAPRAAVSQDATPNPDATPETDAKASQTPAASGEESAWDRLKQILETKAADERARLAKAIEPRLADLALDYGNRDNRDYLDREFDAIAKLDPDVVAVLVPMLVPTKDDGGSKNRADNARRILERFDLTPYSSRLERLAKEAPSVYGRLRSLRLLARCGQESATPLLEAAMKDLPEIYIPELLTAIGETRNSTFVDKLVPFLGRPSEAQRMAALAALAKIGAAKAIAPATKAAVELANDIAYEHLLDLLEATRTSLGAGDRVPFALALVESLKRADSLDTRDALRAIAFSRDLGSDGLGTVSGTLETALLGLVEHPSTDVQFLAARILQDRGDKRAVKKILDRLDEFVKNNKRVPYAWQQRALAQKAFGNPKAAIKDVAQAIKLSPTADPRLHFLAAELELERKAASALIRHLKAAEATPDELRRFRADHPDIEELLSRNSQLRRLFGED
ncbi:MAG: hypothetical protein H6832_07915 [Planctomycetes bacterium]|nr:hypothetical protein [Planctomycetota bacterium]MCB9918315.1 hypothetical protein [Planctomycetota bacterium]